MIDSWGDWVMHLAGAPGRKPELVDWTQANWTNASMGTDRTVRHKTRTLYRSISRRFELLARYGRMHMDASVISSGFALVLLVRK